MPSVEDQHKIRPEDETPLPAWPFPRHAYRDDGIADFGREQMITLLCNDREIEELRVDIAHTGSPGSDCWDACQAALARHIQECKS